MQNRCLCLALLWLSNTTLGCSLGELGSSTKPAGELLLRLSVSKEKGVTQYEVVGHSDRPGAFGRLGRLGHRGDLAVQLNDLDGYNIASGQLAYAGRISRIDLLPDQKLRTTELVSPTAEMLAIVPKPSLPETRLTFGLTMGDAAPVTTHLPLSPDAEGPVVAGGELALVDDPQWMTGGPGSDISGGDVPFLRELHIPSWIPKNEYHPNQTFNIVFVPQGFKDQDAETEALRAFATQLTGDPRFRKPLVNAGPALLPGANGVDRLVELKNKPLQDSIALFHLHDTSLHQADSTNCEPATVQSTWGAAYDRATNAARTYGSFRILDTLFSPNGPSGVVPDLVVVVSARGVCAQSALVQPNGNIWMSGSSFLNPVGFWRLLVKALGADALRVVSDCAGEHLSPDGGMSATVNFENILDKATPGATWGVVNAITRVLADKAGPTLASMANATEFCNGISETGESEAACACAQDQPNTPSGCSDVRIHVAQSPTEVTNDDPLHHLTVYVLMDSPRTNLNLEAVTQQRIPSCDNVATGTMCVRPKWVGYDPANPQRWTEPDKCGQPPAGVDAEGKFGYCWDVFSPDNMSFNWSFKFLSDESTCEAPFAVRRRADDPVDPPDPPPTGSCWQAAPGSGFTVKPRSDGTVEVTSDTGYIAVTLREDADTAYSPDDVSGNGPWTWTWEGILVSEIQLWASDMYCGSVPCPPKHITSFYKTGPCN